MIHLAARFKIPSKHDVAPMECPGVQGSIANSICFNLSLWSA